MRERARAAPRWTRDRADANAGRVGACTLERRIAREKPQCGWLERKPWTRANARRMWRGGENVVRDVFDRLVADVRARRRA